jgi:hypothetical protein
MFLQVKSQYLKILQDGVANKEWENNFVAMLCYFLKEFIIHLKLHFSQTSSDSVMVSTYKAGRFSNMLSLLSLYMMTGYILSTGTLVNRLNRIKVYEGLQTWEILWIDQKY